MLVLFKQVKALNRKKLFLFNAFCFVPILLAAQLDFNTNCLNAYKNVLSLRFQDAQDLLKLERVEHPANLVPYYIENYLDFLGAFIKEEQPVFEKYKKDQDLRFQILEKADHRTPYYHYFLGNIYLQSAILKTKFGEYKSAAFDYSKANSEYKENKTRFPDFLPQYAGMGMVHVLAGIVPDNYAWLLKLVGMDGDIQLGLDEISRVAAYSGDDERIKVFRLEAMFYLSFIDASLGKDSEHALRIVRNFEKVSASFPDPSNPLWVFVKVSILMKNHRNDEALSMLEVYQTHPSGFRFCYLDYLTGLAKLNQLDFLADKFFIRFIKDFKGRNYIKSAYQKLAWCFLLKGDILKYQEYIKMALNHGNLFIDGDKQASREAESKLVPNKILLSARLLNDGGYTDKALHILLDQSVKEIVKCNRDMIEYHYRLGRLYQESGDSPKALSYFEQTIREGCKQPYYFAANAALQSGIIFEQKEDYVNAEKYYRKCLDLEYSEYKTSLDQKAKAGLQRVKKHLY
jgi:tetratricopeptide (TPR) repeat protein